MEDTHLPHKARHKANRKVGAGEVVVKEVARAVVVVVEAEVVEAEEAEEAEEVEVDCDEEVVLLPLMTHSYSHHLIRFLIPHLGENARHPTF